MIDCNNCNHCAPKEGRQTSDKENHMCLKYNKRLFHGTNKTLHDSRIIPCSGCTFNATSTFEDVEKALWWFEDTKRSVDAEIYASGHDCIGFNLNLETWELFNVAIEALREKRDRDKPLISKFKLKW